MNDKKLNVELKDCPLPKLYRCNHRDTHPGPLTVLDVVEAIREQAKRKQMEADCKVVCWVCHEKDAPVYIGGGEWVHEDKSIESDDVDGDTCEASAIRESYAKAHPEVTHD